MTTATHETSEALRETAASIRGAVLAFAESSDHVDVQRWWQMARAQYEEFEPSSAPVMELRGWVETTLEALFNAFARPDTEAFSALEAQLLGFADRASALLVSLQADPDTTRTADAVVQDAAQWLSDTIVRTLSGEP